VRRTARSADAPARGPRFRLRPIGVFRSTLRTRAEAPRQADEGAPDAWLEVHPWAVRALGGVAPGTRVVTVREVVGRRLRIGPIEAIDGTPVVDLKPPLAS
jgi:tRNA (Thr-GGU) A37 N-methylase